MTFLAWLFRRRPRTVAEVDGRMARLLAISIAQATNRSRGWLT